MSTKLPPVGGAVTVDPNDVSVGTGPLTPSEKQLQALIKRRHPEYAELKDHWDFCEDTYEGGPEWFGDHLFRYIKEGEKEYGDRVRRAYRFNHTREVVDMLNKYLFRQVVVRSENAPESVKRFWNSCTKNGLGISEFARQIGKMTSIKGRVGIVVDRIGGGANLSVAEAKRQGVRTYAYAVGPEQLLDYSFAEDGTLNWVLVLEVRRDDKDPLNDSGDEVEQYRLWTKTEWMLFQEVKEGRRKTVKLIDQSTHGLGEVPVVLADHVISDEEWCAPALIDDIAYLDRAVANYLSNLDAIIQDQTFSQLVMPAQNLLPGEDDYKKMVEMGTKRIFLYDGEGGAAPSYLSPDPKQASMILAVINKIINEIYHTVGLAGERTKQDNAMGIDNSSGVAKAYDFERVNALLASKADSMELIENKVAHLVALWNGESKPGEQEKIVSYAEDFDVRGLYDEFDIAARLALIAAPDAIRQEQMRTVVNKLFPQLKEELKNKIEAQLKGWPIDPMTQVAPGDKKPGEPSRQGQNNKPAEKK